MLRERCKSCILVNEQSDIISVINIREGVLADLDAGFTTDVLHDEIHCSAKQGGSYNTCLLYTSDAADE